MLAICILYAIQTDMNKDSPIHALIAEAEQDHVRGKSMVDEGKRIMEQAAITLAAYQRALKAVAPQRVAAEAELASESPRETSPEVAKTPSFSKVSDKWRGIYRTLYRQGCAPYSYDDVVLAMHTRGYSESKKSSIRSHMLQCVQSGLFEKPADGKFEFSSAAIAALQLDDPRIEPVRGSSENLAKLVGFDKEPSVSPTFFGGT